jgi:hypothetical protein
MKSLKVVLGVGGVVAILVVSLLAVSPVIGSAQADAFTGTWELNTAKSKYTPGPAPKSNTAVYEAAGQGIKVSAKGMSADGKPTITQYTANYDGKDYPVTGNPDYDTIALKRIDSHQTEFTRKRAGKVVQTGTNVVSKDGKTRTITATGVNAQGQKITTVGVYEKR